MGIKSVVNKVKRAVTATPTLHSATIPLQTTWLFEDLCGDSWSKGTQPIANRKPGDVVVSQSAEYDDGHVIQVQVIVDKDGGGFVRFRLIAPISNKTVKKIDYDGVPNAAVYLQYNKENEYGVKFDKGYTYAGSGGRHGGGQWDY